MEADGSYRRGVELHRQGRPVEAVRAFFRALALAPDFVPALTDLAALMHQMGQTTLALACLRRALRRGPFRADDLVSLASMLHWSGRTAEALAAIERLLAVEPTHGRGLLDHAMLSLPVMASDIAEAERAVAQFDSRLARLCGPAAAGCLTTAWGQSLPFYAAYRQGNQRPRLQAYGRLVSSSMAACFPTPAGPPPPRSRRRLAIVSNHLRRHSIWDVLLHGLLIHIDRSRFEVVLLNTMALADGETERARGLCERFHSCLTFESAMEALAGERPDIIYYPEIGMDAVTARLAGLRLAPLQTAGWGHPLTSGLPEIDLFFSGEQMEGPDAQDHYSERLVRLPGTGAFTVMPPVAALPLDGPDWPGDPRRIDIALCQNPYKFDPAHDHLYAELAAALPDSRFWMLFEPSRLDLYRILHRRLQTAFQDRGQDLERRMAWRPWLPRPQFMTFLQRSSFALDCPGFSGYTTAWQALHCGLPLVTWEGPQMRQKMAAGLLREIGETDTIAQSATDYLAIAVRLAGEADKDRRRQRLRAAIGATDNRLEVVRAFEQAISL
ncbi:MAG TPA: hypothetical protein HPQ04_16350 [Rhodospirillaceae bacterium]|nr:hypothetical protein [Rhodospirillaceae bacterium]